MKLKKDLIMGRCFSIFIILLLVFSCKKNTIDVAIKQLNLNTTFNLNSVLYLSPAIGIAAGGDTYTDDIIFKTIDSGNTWQQINLNFGTSKAILASTVFENNKIICGGASGYSILSNDSGSTWTFMQLPSYQSINDLANNNNALWLCGSINKGGHITKTNQYFTNIIQQNFTSEFLSIAFSNNNFGAACGGSAIYTTKDSGNTWQITSAASDLFMKIIITPNQNIFACGLNGSIIFSKDNGVSFNTITKQNGFASNTRFTNMVHTSNNFIFVIGDAGVMYKLNLNESPISMQKLNINITKNLKGICIKNNNTIAIVGEGGSYFEIGY
jgi:photosystem II stability/assembly factor-like uncharacterized protein